MCLVKAIVGKRLKRLEDLLNHASGHATLCGAGDELLLQPSQHVFLLLSHRITERVRLRAREAAECRRRRHDVLLVDEDAIGTLQERLKEWMKVGDRFRPVLTANIRGDVRHRPRSIERHHGG